MEINKSVILITGGATRFGKVMTSRLIQEGATVIVHYNTNKEGSDSIVMQHGNAQAIQADLTNTNDIQRLLDTIFATHNKLDAIINNASMFEAIDIEDLTIPQWEYQQTLHNTAPFLLSKALYQYKKNYGGQMFSGCIINIIDSSIDHPSKKRVAYGCAKSALLGQTRILAASMAPWVRVNAISPGFFLSSSASDDAYKEKLLQRLPLQKLAEEEDILDAILLLLNNESITGIHIAVDCGEHLL